MSFTISLLSKVIVVLAYILVFFLITFLIAVLALFLAIKYNRRLEVEWKNFCFRLKLSKNYSKAKKTNLPNLKKPFERKKAKDKRTKSKKKKLVNYEKEQTENKGI